MKKKNLLVSCMGFWFYLSCWLGKLRICSCLACVYRVMNARGKFGEHEKCVGVARGVAEISSSFLSALQASQVHPLYSIYAQLKAWANSFITERQQGSARRSLLLRILTTPKKSKQTSLLGWSKTRHIYYFGFSENMWSSWPITVNENLKIYGKNGENQSQMNSCH